MGTSCLSNRQHAGWVDGRVMSGIWGDGGWWGKGGLMGGGGGRWVS